MPRRRWAEASLVGLMLGATLAPATAASAPSETQACLTAYSESQLLRKDGQLQAARHELLICSQDHCPAVVKTDCLPWLSEVDQALPSIVVVAKDTAGRDTVAVRTIIDGKVVAESLDGRPLVLDPGRHQIRFEHGAAPPIEQTIVTQEGVKNRRVDVSFAPDPPATVPLAPTAVPPDHPPERGEPIVGYVLGGVGVLALGSFALFGLLGKAEADEYEETCAPTKTCDETEVDGTRTKLLVADVSLVLGIAALGVGVTLIVHHELSDPEPAGAAARLELRPLPGGATGMLTWPF
ncbi:MAG: hypothetical protein DRI90_00330 [Deltaproteobacteria bacterium]|nr:MAG: hypothetical protein DRI90_00330 [Deltaproteobacteria bacterium]